jgi:hypothetical protein
MDGRPGADPWVFFNWQEGGGGTWNNWDNQLFWFLGQHLFLFYMTLFGAIASVGWLGWRFVRKQRGRGRYARLENRSGGHVV